ncbi:MAG: hypothetical protein AAGA38_11140 [Pseudomonadota bacterium]
MPGISPPPPLVLDPITVPGLGRGFCAEDIGGVAGGGGQVFGGGAAASAASRSVSSNVAIQLVGSENATFTRDQMRDLIEHLNEAQEGGSIIRLV